jgi:pilus assembly protein CpaC
VKARAGVTIACVSAFTFVFCATGALWAQTTAPAAPPATPPVGLSNQDSANDLSVTVGKSVVLDLARPVTRIVVGLGGFAQATAVSPTQVLVDGKTPGETTLILWDTGGGRQFFNVTVRPSTYAINDQVESLRRELRAELPGQDIKVSDENGNIFLRGDVRDLNSSDRAVAIASTAGKVVNLLNVAVPPPEKQILLKIRFASVDRQKERQLGINIFSTGFGNTVFQSTTNAFSGTSVTIPTDGTAASATVSNELNLFAFYPGLNIGAAMEALDTRGVTESLAEPNLLTENGKEASFLAGGEYPFPMIQGTGAGGGGAVTIGFKEYGIRLSFIPTITPQGLIHLQVAPEVSALDFGNAVTIGGFTEPAISVRRVRTEVDLRDGQSFAIGGLLDNTETESFQKVPFLGDIPILGKLFQSMTRTKNNTELIVIVTPELVSPVPEGATIPLPRFAAPFLPPNSNTPMNTPETKSAETTLGPPPATMPVEQLIERMKPEKPLSEGTGGGMLP